MNTPEIESYWQDFIDGQPGASPYRGCSYIVEAWGDSPAMADELGALIAQGIKTATCSAVWEWEAEGENPPQVGLITVVVDGQGRPLCIVETVEVSIHPYNQVDARFAHDEGEGDRSLAYWREAHRRFFTRSLAKIGRPFAEDMPLVCERFKKIHPSATQEVPHARP